MTLNERKIRILEAIINDYIATAEPIGSRTIAKKYDMGISSATIRNEMSDLEEMGYIMQPHASSGRVPSDKGYRLYVDSLMRQRELGDDELAFLRRIINGNINQIDYLMRETAKAISLLTNYTTIVSQPSVPANQIRHIQLMPLDEHSLLMACILEPMAVKNQIVRVSKAPDTAALTLLSNILNKHLNSLSKDSISKEIVSKIAQEARDFADILKAVLEAVFQSLDPGEDVQVYTSGIKNILAFPEFSDLDKARAIFQTLEEKDLLITLLGNPYNEDDSIQILIGSENNLSNMQDCSIIKTNYRMNGHNIGSIGILGPTRMDYSQVVAVLNAIVNNLSGVIKAFEKG